MKTARNWIRSRDISVWIDVPCLFSANSTRSLKCSFFRVALVHDHSVWVGSCWDNHCSVGATSLDSSVVHYILWEVLIDISAIRILELWFALYESWHRSKILPSTHTISSIVISSKHICFA